MVSFQSLVLGLSFDKGKLMALDPLCSQRINHQAAEFQNNRIWGDAGLGLALLAFVWNGSRDISPDSKLLNLTQGFSLISTTAILYYSAGDPVIQKHTLNDLDLNGLEKEEVAYSILKYNATRSKVARINSGMILMATGVGYACLTTLATGATDSYKLTLNISAAIFFIQGLLVSNNPNQNEIDMDKIDQLVGVTN